VVATNADGLDELAAPLDLLLTLPLFGLVDRIAPNLSWPRFVLNLARRPRTVASRAAALGKELVAVAAGRSDLAAAKGDKRFADPAWAGNPLLKRNHAGVPGRQ
jgi:polyhydroxyalkanoate synthase subunit PhaC